MSNQLNSSKIHETVIDPLLCSLLQPINSSTEALHGMLLHEQYHGIEIGLATHGAPNPYPDLPRTSSCLQQSHILMRNTCNTVQGQNMKRNAANILLPFSIKLMHKRSTKLKIISTCKYSVNFVMICLTIQIKWRSSSK